MHAEPVLRVQDAMPAATDVPLRVRAPLNQTLFLELLASGTQVYECASATPGKVPAWRASGQEADLTTRSGDAAGRLRGAATWESRDGSSVSAEVRATDAGPDSGALPWQLLSATHSSGAGVLTQTKSVQRLQTIGGLPPTRPCEPSMQGESVRIPFAASYAFYRVNR